MNGNPDPSLIVIGTLPTTLAGYGITDAQPLDADLTAIAALTSTGALERTGANTFATFTVTAAAKTILDDATTGAMLTSLGGTTVGANFFTLANPDAIRFIRINADNTISALSAADSLTALGAASAASPTFTGTATFNTTGAVIIPVGTTDQRPASPSVGMFRFNTSLANWEFYDGTLWRQDLDYTFALHQRAIFGYGFTDVNVSMTNLVSNLGVVAADTTGVGTARYYLAAAGYGGDKAIFGYGFTSVSVSMTNLVSNLGVVAADATGVGTARHALAAAGYGGDKAIFGYGITSVNVSMTNLVSNLGVVAANTTGVGTARYFLAAAGYGN
jgi:hypothetical protein